MKTDCPVCTENNCTYQRCKDILEQIEEVFEEDELEDIIKQLYPE